MIEKWRKVFLSCFVFGSDRFSEYVLAISDWLSVPRVYVGWEWHNWGIIGLRCLFFPRFLCDICAQNVLFATASLKWRATRERKAKTSREKWLIDNWQLSIFCSDVFTHLLLPACCQLYAACLAFFHCVGGVTGALFSTVRQFNKRDINST